MHVEKVTVGQARWQRLNTMIDGVRYFEIKTIIKSLSSAQKKHGAPEAANVDSPILIDMKVVHRRYTDFVTLHAELVD